MSNKTRQKKLAYDNAIRIPTHQPQPPLERLPQEMHGLPPGYEHLQGADTEEILVVMYQHVFELTKEVERLKRKIS